MAFFGVHHKFKDGKAKAFFDNVASWKDDDFKAAADKNVKNGVWNHSFMPSGGEGDVYCIWETKADMSVSDFQKFIDGPEGPAEGTFDNKVHKVLPGASNPESFFAKGPAASSDKSSGAFFWVHHEFKEGQAEGFFKMVSEMKAEEWGKMHEGNNKLGFHNHTFQPMGAQGPCYCIWESEKDMSIEEFQKFIDGPNGPGAGKVFTNVVYKSGMGTTPSAHFKA